MKENSFVSKKICLKAVSVSVVLVLTVIFSGTVFANTSRINDTKHDLSAWSLGATIKASQETRICVFCHTPHNATPDTPLWNRKDAGGTYTPYSNQVGNPPTLFATIGQPTGYSRLCLGCHDGTVSNLIGNRLGDVLRPKLEGGIPMFNNVNSIPQGCVSNPSICPSDLGNDLRFDHPVSFPYADSTANPKIVSPPPKDIDFYGPFKTLECSSCHDPHDNSHGAFLVMDTISSQLCLKCHDMGSAWQLASHNLSTCSVSALPIAPKTFPAFATLGEWGCEGCHTMHGAGSTQYLFYLSDEATTCLLCHGATSNGLCQPGPAPAPPFHLLNSLQSPGATAKTGRAGNIMAQITKTSGHNSFNRSSSAVRKKASRSEKGNYVTCSDCHNSHAARQKPDQATRGVVRALEKVSGVDRNGVEISVANYGYEICFKCHSDYSKLAPFVTRVVKSANTRLKFDTGNDSYHPIEGVGKNNNVPSLNMTYMDANKAVLLRLGPSSIISCIDCHSDDNGASGGPHGSNYPPLLNSRYETDDGTTESYQSYALCYQCHSRTSILNDDSFRKGINRTASGGGHSGHLAKGAPCSACHDAHGIADSSGITGSHTHLINFDTRIVRPKTGTLYPIFKDMGTFSGSCTLICHGKLHDNLSY